MVFMNHAVSLTAVSLIRSIDPLNQSTFLFLAFDEYFSEKLIKLNVNLSYILTQTATLKIKLSWSYF